MACRSVDASRDRRKALDQCQRSDSPARLKLTMRRTRHHHRRERSRPNTSARVYVQLRGSSWVVCFRAPESRFTRCRSVGVALVEDARRYGSDLVEELIEELMRAAEPSWT